MAPSLDPSPAVPNPDVAAWIERGARGDEAACAAIYQHFGPAVQRLCVGLLGSVADA